MSVPNKKTKMSDLVDSRLKVMLVDGRFFVGTLLAFDKHMNLVLSECHESRLSRRQQALLRAPNPEAPTYEKRSLGLVILRGEQVVSLSIESGPLSDARSRVAAGLTRGSGTSRPLKTPKSIIKSMAGPTLK